jgi:hypothetical protein
LPQLLAQTIPTAATRAIAYKHNSLAELAFLHNQYVLLLRSKSATQQEGMLRAEPR